jgi:drug/metabolite transporter (DMT)-like permease
MTDQTPDAGPPFNPYLALIIGTMAAFWGMALIAQIVGHSTYNWALKWLSAGLIAVSLLGEPMRVKIADLE